MQRKLSWYLLQLGVVISFTLSSLHRLLQRLAARLSLLCRSSVSTGLLKRLPSRILLLMRPVLCFGNLVALLLQANNTANITWQQLGSDIEQSQTIKQAAMRKCKISKVLALTSAHCQIQQPCMRSQ